MKQWCIETPGIWLLTTRMKTAWELSSLPELLGSWFFFLTCKMRYSMIEFPIVYSCQHPQGSGMRSVTSPNRIESPHCWGNLCQGWRDSENFPEQPDSTVAFSPRNLVMKNFTMKHSIASKESLNRNGSREAIWQRAGRLRRPSPKEENHEVKMKRRFLTHWGCSLGNE